MQKKTLVIGVLAGLALGLAAGYILGVKYQKQFFGSKGQPEIIISELKDSKLLRSANLTVLGEVVSISGRGLTLKEGEDEFTFTVKEGATVLRLPGVPTNQGAPTPAEIKFEDIKVGERANLTFSLSVEGKFEVTNVAVFPTP